MTANLTTGGTALPLAGKVAAITGGSSGIGAATARLLAVQGVSIVVGYKNGEERARKLVSELPGDGHVAAQLALEDAASVRHFAAKAGAAFGHVDILVNSAGFTVPVKHADLNALTDEILDSMLINN